MPESTKGTPCVWFEVYRDSITVAHAADERCAESASLGTVGTCQCDIDTLIRRLHAKGARLVFGYEAGPWGYWWHRDLARKGLACHVVAPWRRLRGGQGPSREDYVTGPGSPGRVRATGRAARVGHGLAG